MVASKADDTSRLFVNDGRDLDLKIVSNTDKFIIYPETYICTKFEISPSAIYHFYGLRNINDYFHPRTIGNFVIEPNNVPATISGQRSWRTNEYDPDYCDKNSVNIYAKIKLTVLKTPRTYRIWIRLRQANKYMTFYKDRLLDKKDIRTSYSSTTMQWTTASFLENDITDMGRTIMPKLSLSK